MAHVTGCVSEYPAETLEPGTHGSNGTAPRKPMDEVRVASATNVLRLPAVRRLTGLGRSTIYRMEADRQFPLRVKLSARAVGWLEREVRDWLASRIANSR
jgi:prophage regulatory protein